MSPTRKMPFRSEVDRGDSFTTNLRDEFFRAVDEVAPKLAGEMVQPTGPLFERLAESITEGDLNSFAWIGRDQREFITAWREWAQPYGLHRDSWVLDHALSLLPAFLRNPDIPRSFGGVPFLAAYPVPGRQITPPRPYRPDQETRAEYDKRVEEYADQVEDVARSTGWEPAPAKKYTRLHLLWLARFQVGGETVAAIVPKGQHQRNIERALKDMTRLIGLTRRSLP